MQCGPKQCYEITASKALAGNLDSVYHLKKPSVRIVLNNNSNKQTKGQPKPLRVFAGKDGYYDPETLNLQLRSPKGYIRIEIEADDIITTLPFSAI